MKIKLNAEKSFICIMAYLVPEFLLGVIIVVICGVLCGTDWRVNLIIAAALIALCALAVLTIWILSRLKFIYIDTVNGTVSFRNLFKIKRLEIADASFKLIIYADNEYQCEYKLCVYNNGKKLFSIANTQMQEEYRKADFLQTIQKYLDCEIISKVK